MAGCKNCLPKITSSCLWSLNKGEKTQPDKCKWANWQLLMGLDQKDSAGQSSADDSTSIQTYEALIKFYTLPPCEKRHHFFFIKWENKSLDVQD